MGWIEGMPPAIRPLRAIPHSLALILLLLIGPTRANADPAISVETLIPYSESSEILDSIRRECGLGTRLSRRIVDKGQRLGTAVVRVGNLSATQRGPTLAIRITDALATAGGMFPSKSVSIDGVLKEENKVVGTFVATRFARAGILPSERDDCSIYSHAIDRLAKDVAKWLAEPGMDSHLGDAR